MSEAGRPTWTSKRRLDRQWIPCEDQCDQISIKASVKPTGVLIDATCAASHVPVANLLDEAEYGIGKLKDNTEPYQFYVRGVLTSLKGVRDHLLEDYNQKFSLGISSSDDLSMDSFKQKATNSSNTQALGFIKRLEAEWRTLLSDQKASFLLSRHGIRDLEVHRRPEPQNIAINLPASISVSGTVVVRDPQGNVVASGPFTPSTASPTPVEVKRYFQSWATDDIPTLCDYCLGKLRALVSAMQAAFP